MTDERIVEKLDAINKTLQQILVTTSVRKNIFDKILEYGGSVVAVLSILSIVDIIISWIFGG
ncbi:MAG: hypothetical protein Ta2G_14680 [Termitinemataceae bacterium]|nr:MAG: hypothetical protein Ta2G_14680 [Termitinemataceae bacterium]